MNTKIIAHRGYWEKLNEKNRLSAFERAFLNGYGVETDLRDYCGKLVISHDIADAKCMTSDDFFNLYQQCGNDVPLALNIKADGIQNLLKEQLKKYHVRNYFVFDMSIPEMVVYRREKINFFSRCSDIEKDCVLYESASGIWLDTFYDNKWEILDFAKAGLDVGKEIVIVSPELHGKSADGIWNAIKRECLNTAEGLYLCTDFPKDAKEFFEKG